MRKMKLFSMFLAAITITTFVMGSTASAATNTSPDTVKVNLENSKLNEYSSIPEVKALIDDISKNAVSSNIVETYFKIGKDSKGNQTEKAYTESEYLKEKNKIMPRNLPITQDFGWIKLTLEAYKDKGGNFMAGGFYDWLKQPNFSGSDVLAIGHDATITFDTQSCFGAFMSPSFDSVREKNIQTTQTIDRSNKSKFLSGTSGVAYKFRLGDSHGINIPGEKFPNKMYDNGMMYVRGTVLNGSGNLQVSYGHSQLALDYNIADACKFLSTGAVEFKVKGSQDLKTIGDRIVF
ncbi:hypothetical protein [Clostridium gasigenes]|uniref:Uncharacterized protein n=1 Tax=Clostridium gasigenes TaxID=94869 RepID=A0A1H0T3S5_9CLOT|nr:hypothetical protein [Clostridium gasigenes]MBB6623769.1 hypothetical protein [Clostridium gasigenes]MBU3088901.1 hypothetical protein [Clostridium gasigenes]SDP48752.1 hypothetical protein SAMN04488529_10656 [Clostridium gasigenes]